MTFGVAVRRTRRELGLTQSGLATSAGISAAYISHIEKGRATGSDEVQRRIAAVLGVPVAGLHAVYDPASVTDAAQATSMARDCFYRAVDELKSAAARKARSGDAATVYAQLARRVDALTAQVRGGGSDERKRNSAG